MGRIKLTMTPPEMCDDCDLEELCMGLRDEQLMGIECPWIGKKIAVTIEEVDTDA